MLYSSSQIERQEKATQASEGRTEAKGESSLPEGKLGQNNSSNSNRNSNCPLTAPREKFVVTPGFSHPIIAQLQQLVQTYHIDVCGIEIVVDDKNDAYVIDMNVLNSNYNLKAEEAAQVPVGGAEAVALFCIEEYQRFALND